MNRIKVLAAYVKSIELLALFLMVVFVLSSEAAAPKVGAKKGRIPFEASRIIIEFNSTAQDVGIQVFLDGEAWKKVQIVGPDGKITEIMGKGNVRNIGLSELFFEGDEPALADLPLDQFLALFPEGEYKFFGKGVEGEDLTGTATFTHVIPCGPEIVSPPEGAELDPNNIVIKWNAVPHKVNLETGKCDDASNIEILGYQVTVERENPLRTFSVDLPASVTRVRVPRTFLEPGTEYKIEVLAIETGRNQTITESFFCTEPLTPCPPPAP
jgi:hypothetical protein